MRCLSKLIFQHNTRAFIQTSGITLHKTIVHLIVFTLFLANVDVLNNKAEVRGKRCFGTL
jgi:hypothetical protein